ncbi:MAG: aldolase/citrate lyase family protein [Alphaproteobacteria bacterium]|nr:aldolase/citrate lyase family protein [Alphaproteobacteria bacterium]MDX5368902.1 aldolase/citrate lyase family protein [Alphaproteobacteria bacterium]MDX5463626.1 aldolase/citrate lyase family protein [Alphaproteobacteria bacterium]
MTLRNIARERLERGELSLGVGLRQARTVDTGKLMRTAGFDWLFLDMEHNSMDIDCAVQICVAAQDAGITPIVRVPGWEKFHATRALDGGAQGIVVPHVDTPELAARMVEACKYPPVGHRSVTSALPQVDFESPPLAEVTAAINASTLLVIMLESPQAIANADAIAAVPGVDILLIGCSDLSMEMGIPGKVDAPEMEAAVRTVVAACAKHGKHAGFGGVGAPEVIERYIGHGMRFVLCGSDLTIFLAAARQRTAHLRGLALE